MPGAAREAHSDDLPIESALFPSNWELSGARASAVLRHLIAAGVDPALLHVAGYADTHPVASNVTDEGRAQNRRVEFVFDYDQVAAP
jgi:chemotaxis protein MotB